jgi:hypothetical protein
MSKCSWKWNRTIGSYDYWNNFWWWITMTCHLMIVVVDVFFRSHERPSEFINLSHAWSRAAEGEWTAIGSQTKYYLESICGENCRSTNVLRNMFLPHHVMMFATWWCKLCGDELLWDAILLCDLLWALSAFWANFVDVLLVWFVDVLLEGPSWVTIAKLLISYYCSKSS